MAELPHRPAGLVIRQERARGSYGAVYSGLLNGKPVVVKRIHQLLLHAPNNGKLLRDFYHECRILSTVRHANVVSFVGAFWDAETREPLLVMEAAKENLREYLDRNIARLDLFRQLAISSSMAEGLSFLHARAEPIVHRDLKPENVLVSEDGTIKIADFGQSKLLAHAHDYMRTTQPGTVAYMPPEALKKNPRYTTKVDVFSLGAVMLEVTTQCPPSVCLEGIGTVPEVVRHKDDLALLPPTHPLKPLIVWCLQDSHESRPDVQSTLDHMKLLACGMMMPHCLQTIQCQNAVLREHLDKDSGLQGRLEEAARELLKATEREVALQGKLLKSTQQLLDTKEREAGLQGKLMNATQELLSAKVQVLDLQQMLEKERRDLRDDKKQFEKKQEELINANHELKTSKTELARAFELMGTTCEELKVVSNQLEVATIGLCDTEREKESLEAQLTHLRQTVDALTAAMEKKCLSKVSMMRPPPPTSPEQPAYLPVPFQSGEAPHCQCPECSEVCAVDNNGRCLACYKVHHTVEERQLREFQECSDGQGCDSHSWTSDDCGPRGDSGCQESDGSHLRGDISGQEGDSGRQGGDGGGRGGDSGGQRGDSSGQGGDGGGHGGDGGGQRGDGGGQGGDGGDQGGDSDVQGGDNGDQGSNSGARGGDSSGQGSDSVLGGNYSSTRSSEDSAGGGVDRSGGQGGDSGRKGSSTRSCSVM